jgi:hypothetical protein
MSKTFKEKIGVFKFYQIKKYEPGRNLTPPLVEIIFFWDGNTFLRKKRAALNPRPSGYF